MMMDLQQIYYVYSDKDYLKENLNAVRELRNTVNYYRMLLVYEDIEECYFDLYQLLIPYYKNFFKNWINGICYDRDNYGFRIS